MAKRIDSYELRFTNGGEPSDVDRIRIGRAYTEWRLAVDYGSGDDEVSTADDLINVLLDFASIEIDEVEVERCDECDEEATEFWPNLKEPVQLCASCEHNARRSGWEPGR